MTPSVSGYLKKMEYKIEISGTWEMSNQHAQEMTTLLHTRHVHKYKSIEIAMILARRLFEKVCRKMYQSGVKYDTSIKHLHIYLRLL